MPRENGTSEGRYILKAGKLIRVYAVFRNSKIVSVRITGDFFIYPESKMEELENSLQNKDVKDVKEIAESVFDEAEYIGISPELVAMAIDEAWKRRE